MPKGAGCWEFNSAIRIPKSAFLDVGLGEVEDATTAVGSIFDSKGKGIVFASEHLLQDSMRSGRDKTGL